MVKKEGSTLVTVLGVTVIFMTLAVTILTSIMGTMKANNSQKVREDLKYAAESGLEIARSYLNGRNTITKGDIDTINDMLKKTLVDTNNDGLPDSEVGKVELVSPTIDGSGNIIDTPKDPTVTGKSEKFTVRIRAEKKDETDVREYAGVNYEKNDGNSKNIFEYGLVAGQGGIDIWKDCLNNPCDIKKTHGDIDYSTTTISSANGTIIHGERKPSNEAEKDKFEENKYSKIEFLNQMGRESNISMRKKETASIDKDSLFYYKFYKTDNEEMIPVTNIKLKLAANGEWTTATGINGDNKEIKKEIETKIASEKSPILKIEATGLGPFSMNIVFINSDILNLDIIASLDFTNTVLITNGSVKATGKGSLTLSYSTLYANKIDIDKDTSITINEQSGTEGHGISKNKEEILNELIEMIVPNWKQGSGVITEKMGLKEDTFSN
ncbi:MAG: pilus assembly PilX N-terminal domain-containing protein [Clostridium sp.]|uniref:pilus assembly PilX N-terminal domain-containing protein n=1 Tax=Clostridium sp. TaxID=1506 RepID=UPI003F34EFE5